jgi:L-lactate utilization protein LutC
MNAPRDALLKRVRQAVRTGNRAGYAPPLPARGEVGYQGAGPDPVARFCNEFKAAGGLTYPVADVQAAAGRVFELIQTKGARRVLLGRGMVLEPLGLPERLRALGVEILQVDGFALDATRPGMFAADASITGVDYLVAETGSLAIQCSPDNPRSLSLLPPIHVAVARPDQIVRDLFDLFGPETWHPNPVLPSCISLITGPSKTGDIELRLVTGVHGPGEVHLVLIA